MKVFVVFGTRPEAIKLAPVIQELQRRAVEGKLRAEVCITGQHREMLHQMLQLFGITPNYDLNLMAQDQTPTQVASATLSSLEPLFQQGRPDWVVVQGDTTTAAAASIACFYSQIKLAHVEAGLRSYDKWQPFPEEINRRITTVIADLHLAATPQACQNLREEGIPKARIVVTGNPVIDALYQVARLPPPPDIESLLYQTVKHSKVGLSNVSTLKRLILVTAHRRENFGQPLENVCLALKALAHRYRDTAHIIYSVHLNPNVWRPVHRFLEGVPNITLLPPLDYLSLVHLMQCSYLILTDSGGIQEEAPALGKPVLVLREVTERPEAVAAGVAKVIGTGRERIVEEAARLLEDQAEYQAMAQAVNPYGDGHASQRIVAALLGEPVKPFTSPDVGLTRQKRKKELY